MKTRRPGGSTQRARGGGRGRCGDHGAAEGRGVLEKRRGGNSPSQVHRVSLSSPEKRFLWVLRAANLILLCNNVTQPWQQTSFGIKPRRANRHAGKPARVDAAGYMKAHLISTEPTTEAAWTPLSLQHTITPRPPPPWPRCQERTLTLSSSKSWSKP